MILIMLCAIGCANTLEKTDSFCIWAKPITVNNNELESISIETLKQIDNFNRHYDELCVN